MKFRTEINIPLSQREIDYRSSTLLLGSCFADSIGGKLTEAKFPAVVNPVGVLFNPLSICAALDRFAACERVELSELHQGRGGEWFHFDFHGSLSRNCAEEAKKAMDAAVERGHKALMAADTIMLTLGTAWIYELASSGRVVANCHKEPSQLFERRAMSVEQITQVLSAQVERYADKHFIFTLSPVRHLSDGLDQNSLSKSTLRVAISEVVARYDNASYFPAYEILVDDLRDYRFYADDMLHPSAQAVDYIWSKFADSQLSAQAREQMKIIGEVVRAAAHRPFSVESSAHQGFCRRQLEVINRYPNIDFGKEYEYFLSQLQNNL